MLLKILNNIGIIGACLAAVADIICVIIFVFGIDMRMDMKSMVIFACINAFIGVLINVFLRYQGQKYGEIENEELCTIYYAKKVNENKKHISMGLWQVLNAIVDIVLKGGSAAFSVFGVIYISIEGSKNPIQILITLVTLVLFACFGLMNMNSAYCRFYNVQIPYMQKKIKEKEISENGTI